MQTAVETAAAQNAEKIQLNTAEKMDQPAKQYFKRYQQLIKLEVVTFLGPCKRKLHL